MRRLGAIAVFGVWLAVCSVAGAAFPGGNGLLAVQPLHGNGIVLVAANGRGAHRICTNVGVCGHPVRPRFSPDGRSIVFAGPAVRIVATDGSCRSCNFGVARNPAFLPGGSLVSLVLPAAIGTEVDIDSVVGVRRATLPYSKRLGYSYPTDAVWAPTGALAEVAGGRVLAGSAGDLRGVGAGSDPSWSPDGSRIALVRRGWITVVHVTDGRTRQVARGTAPAFSPDGRRIAFVDGRHRVEVVAASGGRPRPVGHVEGVAVDWQPLVARRPSCVPPPGSQVIASSPQAVITSNSVQDPYGGISVIGCLLATGRERLLEVIPESDPPGSVLAGTSGNYAAVVTQGGDKGGNVGGSTTVFDLRTGHRTGFGGEGYACDTFEQVCGDIDQVVVGAGGVSAVHLDGGTVPFWISASCAPQASMCLANGLRNVSSTDPGQAPWASMPFQDATGLACASTSMCVAVAGSTIYTSTNPTAAPPSWTATQLQNAGITRASCPSAKLCVLATAWGNVWWSTDPTGGTAAWANEDVDSDITINGIACPATTECVAMDEYGRALSTSDPTGGPSGWQVRQVFNSAGAAPAISCPSATLCIAAQASSYLNENSGSFAVTTDPAAGRWTTSTAPDQPSSLDCPSVSLCVAIGKKVIVSTDPASGNWSSYTIPGLDYPASISCSSAQECIIGGQTAGFVFVSSDPAGGPGPWKRVLAEPVSCGDPGVTCGTEQILASDRAGLHTLDSSTGYEPQTGPQLTGMTFTGDTLSWNDHGSRHTASLKP